MSNSVAFRTDRESDPTSFPPRSRLLLGTAPALGFRSQSNVFECVAIDCVTLVSQTEDAKGHPNIISEECSTGKYEKVWCGPVCRLRGVRLLWWTVGQRLHYDVRMGQ